MTTRNSVTSRRTEQQSSNGGDNFKVAVRVRPLIEREIKSGTRCVEVDDERKAVVISKPLSRRRSQQVGVADIGEYVRTDINSTHDFYFDLIFKPEATQDEVFVSGVKEIVESVLDGYNGSVIASGQTGSGKTFTIEGGMAKHKGIIPRAAEMIFQYIENYPSKTDRFLVRASYLEIYNDRISDLLDPNHENLRLREDGVGMVFVESLSEHVVRNTAGIMNLLHDGTLLRATRSTRMNKESSRSHAVFTVIVEHGVYHNSGASVITIGKLRLVDLAGSERLDVDARSRHQEETKNINVSLHTFSKVVTALTTAGAKHIPYRDSKLTRILQDCLGGNCKTILIATITPIATCYGESLSTLKFAQRAKRIKNKASINKDMSQKALLSAYQLEIRKLKEQLNQQSNDSVKEEVEKLEQDMLEARKEKDEVLSQLKDHQQRVSEAENEKTALIEKVLKLEQMVLHGSQDINKSAEFKKAVEQEQARIRREAESQYESKLAELESEKKRLVDEKARVEEYYARLKAEQKCDFAGGKDEKSGGTVEEVEQECSPIKRKTLSAQGPLPIPILIPKKSDKAPNFHHPTFRTASTLGGGHTQLYTPPLLTQSQRTATFRTASTLGGGHTHPYIPPLLTQSQRTASVDTLTPRHQHSFQPDLAPSMQSGQAHMQMDPVSAAALKEYTSALSHPRTGIPCQELRTGVRIFTGSDCVKWFRQHMIGVTTMQQAQDVGQRLLDLGVFLEIKGNAKFVVSDQVYYQFSDTPVRPENHIASRMTSAKSLQFPLHYHIPHQPHSPHHYQSHRSLVDGTMADDTSRRGSMHGTLTSASTTSRRAAQPSALPPYNQSVTSNLVSNSPNLLDHYQLSKLSPTELHISALHGDREKVKSLAQEMSVDCLDAGGHTPLMYAIMGRHQKCCLQLLLLHAEVNVVNAYSRTSLMLAAALDCHGIIKTLLKHGADAEVMNDDGETVFHFAAKSKNAKCLDYLCRYSPSLRGVNARSHLYQTPLHVAVMSDFPDNVRHIVSTQQADLGVSDKDGRTPLHYAVSHHTPSCALAIVDTMPNDVNLVDKDRGWSALHLACSDDKNADLAQVLMDCPSCDLNLRSKDGNTPLHLAVCSNSINITSLLVYKGASTNLKDAQKKTALQLALDLGYRQCASLISARGDRSQSN